ncbi:MAG: pyridoxamine 5'-phosphate oxidase family protein, partial [Peptococcaceae bacterium]|nr:pyridoxamine 5'-phosphate oxidase family protein [Peptococcaceae bacterium]
MQNRMKNHPLTEEQIATLLTKAPVGRIATIGPDGYPYIVPMHFVYYNKTIYTHCLPKGQKSDYISKNKKVGFEVDEMLGLLYDNIEIPCDTNTIFNSVIISGNANMIVDLNEKREILNKFVDKYTPHLSKKALPENIVKGT